MCTALRDRNHQPRPKIEMETAISATTAELISRFISFLIKKYKNQACLEDKLQRLQHLLLRVHTVVEEADGRYVTNSRMLIQLGIFVQGMYRGYYVLDTVKYKPLVESIQEEVGSSSSISFSNPMKRIRTIAGTDKNIVDNDELHSVLENLETIAANMSEFIILLGGCERMFRRPYDTYLYIDNFMFGRYVEKQQMINMLLQNSSHLSAAMVLPIIGGCRVGKKTLVAHVCNDDKVRSHFSSILNIEGDSISRLDHKKFNHERVLVVVEFCSDVDDEDWLKFYSSVKLMGEGSKVIIISRLEKVLRFGTVKPIRLNSMSLEEYSYLFKMLAFGSANPEDYPQLAIIANELARVLGGSFITANVAADKMRKKLNAQFWLHILQRFKGMVENNMTKFGKHPKDILDQEQAIDITKFASTSNTVSLRLMPPHIEKDGVPRRKLPRLMFGDLIAGCAMVPKEDFELVSWEARIPPYTKLVHFVATCAEEKPKDATILGKRQGFQN